MYEPERRIDVDWARDDSTPTAYPVKLTVYCDNKFGMLKNITSIIGDAQSNIRNIGAHTENSQASVEIVLDISDLKHLEQIMAGLRKIPAYMKSRDYRRSKPQFSAATCRSHVAAALPPSWTAGAIRDITAVLLQRADGAVYVHVGVCIHPGKHRQQDQLQNQAFHGTLLSGLSLGQDQTAFEVLSP
jgi:hypothetical protein